VIPAAKVIVSPAAAVVIALRSEPAPLSAGARHRDRRGLCCGVKEKQEQNGEQMTATLHGNPQNNRNWMEIVIVNDYKDSILSRGLLKQNRMRAPSQKTSERFARVGRDGDCP
jgi:hypothetical protein